MTTGEKINLIESDNSQLSLNKKCELLSLSKSVYYYKPIEMDSYSLLLMDHIDKQHTKVPFYGSRKMMVYLKSIGYPVNRKRVQRLMGLMKIQAIYPGLNLSKARKGHKIYPYLLNNIDINRPNYVWSTDITYIRVQKGFVYLIAVLDWYSRYVLSWKLSTSLDMVFCIEALYEALEKHRIPEIFNTDQGSQFTSETFTNILKSRNIKISMDSKGRAFDNIFIERLWRSVKYEEVYLNDYQTVKETKESLKKYFKFYNNERFHQSLSYKTPNDIHYGNN